MIGSTLSKLPVSKPADWGHKVTICIAALCEDRRVVVSASDMLASLGPVTTDLAVLKTDVLYPRWAVMSAGEDIEYIDPILKRTRQLLSRQYRRKSPEEVAAKLSQAYHEKLQQLITDKVLRRHGYTVATFRDSAKKKMSASAFNTLMARIAAQKLSLSFLAFGQDQELNAHIFGVRGEETPTSYDKVGYWAIGEGAPTALASLGFFNRFPQLSGHIPLERCVYQVLAAKFMAEATGSVGRQTFFAVHGPGDGQARFLFLSDEQKIRDAWQFVGAPRIPDDIEKMISGMLYSPSDENAAARKAKADAEWLKMVEIRPSIAQR